MPLSYSLAATVCVYIFFFNDTATTEIYTLSLHDALPIWSAIARCATWRAGSRSWCSTPAQARTCPTARECSASRSEEHTSELQSRLHLVCRLLLEKKKKHKRQVSLDAEAQVMYITTEPRR